MQTDASGKEAQQNQEARTCEYGEMEMAAERRAVKGRLLARSAALKVMEGTRRVLGHSVPLIIINTHTRQDVRVAATIGPPDSNTSNRNPVLANS